MPYTLGEYTNNDIYQQTIDLLNNLGASPISPGVTIVPGENVQTVDIYTNSSTIDEGFIFLSIMNTGDNAGTVMGKTIQSGATFTFPAILNNTYNTAVSYDATGTEFTVIKVFKA